MNAHYIYTTLKCLNKLINLRDYKIEVLYSCNKNCTFKVDMINKIIEFIVSVGE